MRHLIYIPVLLSISLISFAGSKNSAGKPYWQNNKQKKQVTVKYQRNKQVTKAINSYTSKEQTSSENNKYSNLTYKSASANSNTSSSTISANKNNKISSYSNSSYRALNFQSNTKLKNDFSNHQNTNSKKVNEHDINLIRSTDSIVFFDKNHPDEKREAIRRISIKGSKIIIDAMSGKQCNLDLMGMPVSDDKKIEEIKKIKSYFAYGSNRNITCYKTTTNKIAGFKIEANLSQHCAECGFVSSSSSVNSLLLHNLVDKDKTENKNILLDELSDLAINILLGGDFDLSGL